VEGLLVAQQEQLERYLADQRSQFEMYLANQQVKFDARLQAVENISKSASAHLLPPGPPLELMPA
jgi:hypothetical protein